MRAPLYEEIHRLSLIIVNATLEENDQQASDAYEALNNLCLENEASERDHPLQWEALGDFSEKHLSALEAYQKGLALSQKLALPEYTASILLAMAESYLEEGSTTKAMQLLDEAKNEASHSNDQALKAAIDELLAENNSERSPDGNHQ